MENSASPLWRDPVLYFLLICGSLTVMGGAVLAPILPELIAHLHLSQGWAGSLVSVHYLTMAISSPLLGILADRCGQVRLLMQCLMIYAVAGVGGAFLPDYPTLLVDRALLGIASGGVAAASLGLLTRRYEGQLRQQAIAYAATAITLANILYPLLSVGLGQFNWRFAFGLYGTSAVLAVMVPFLFHTAFTHAAVPSSHGGTGVGGQAIVLLKSPVCLRIFISLSTISAVVYGTIIYLPIYLKTVLGSDIIWNGVILAVQAIGAALSSGLLMGPLTRKFGSLRLSSVSVGWMVLFLLGLPHLTQLWILMLVSSLFGLSFGLVTPSFYSMLSNFAPVQLQSSILAAGIGAGFLGQFVSPLILGPVLATQGLLGVFYGCAVLAMLVGIGLLVPLKPAKTIS